MGGILIKDNDSVRMKAIAGTTARPLSRAHNPYNTKNIKSITFSGVSA